MTFTEGQKVRVKLDPERNAELWFDDGEEVSTTRGEALSAWEGVEFIFNGYRPQIGETYVALLPIDGFRPDDFNGNPESFYWDVTEIEAVE